MRLQISRQVYTTSNLRSSLSTAAVGLNPTTASFLRYGKPQADFSMSGICSNNLTQFNAITISAGYGNSKYSQLELGFWKSRNQDQLKIHRLFITLQDITM